MSADQNKQTAKDAYEAFGQGDAEGAMKNMDDSVEWVVGGDNELTGTHTGKEAVGKIWARVGEKTSAAIRRNSLATGTRSWSSAATRSTASRATARTCSPTTPTAS